MTIANIALFKALGAKMEYLSERQRVIAQNIANADTPGYRPQDLKPVNFETVLKDTTGDSKTTGPVVLAATSPQHMGGSNDIANAQETRQKKTYEVAPAGNAVIMEEQMINSNQTAMDYNMITSLYQKNVRMIRSALGVQG